MEFSKENNKCNLLWLVILGAKRLIIQKSVKHNISMALALLIPIVFHRLLNPLPCDQGH
jgi:hypothetical protein